jgi:Fe-S oxidoreductase
MTSPYHSTADSSRHEPGRPLQTVLPEISGKCDNCPSCRKECAFLRKYGTPKEIADAYDSADKTFLAMPFECSLCQLCDAVCPKKVKPSDMFLEMRREKMRRDPLDYPEHAGLLAYEKRGASRLFSYYALPENCDTIFFPGCSLPGTRPEQTLALYERLRKTISGLGIVLDCCMKISHDLGHEDHFRTMFREMRDFLVKNNVQNVLVACPNCYRMFAAYGEGLKTRTVYEILAESATLSAQKVAETVTVHDPCVLRFLPDVHTAVRSLVVRQGLAIEEMPHRGETTLCCGEGGFVASLSPELADAWGTARRGEANGKRAITYCAGCTNRLNGTMPISHIIDLLLEPRATLEGNAGISRAPMTYLNRLRLKRRLRRTIKPPISRERTFTGEGEAKGGGMLKRVLLLGLLAAVILFARFTGITQYLAQETLRQWIQGYGGLAPVIYMLIYAIAPALLLPGLPITIAGGILFGPFWGVFYTITSATVKDLCSG